MVGNVFNNPDLDIFCIYDFEAEASSRPATLSLNQAKHLMVPAQIF